jgi:dTDP-4-dehydrorhamnose reductase
MSKPLIIVTGVSGQLGWEIERLHQSYSSQFNFLFVTRNELDLSKPETISPFFQQHKPNYFINCAAYTAVDKAETEKEIALTVNATSVGLLAKECAAINCAFITFSTDYVFNGNGTKPYRVDERTEPLNYYGATKEAGEKLALENNPNTIIIRTSWVYSSHGNNFVKTMLRLMKEREEIKVVSDQIGSPTYAKDLAEATLQIVLQLKTQNSKPKTQIYHYSNTGVISWHEFAEAIKTLSGLSCRVLPIPSSAFPTPAKRPHYSVMDTENIAADFNIELKDWKQSLQECLKELSSL